MCACACLHCCAGLGEGKQRKRWGSKPASHCALSHAGVLVRVRLRERKARVCVKMCCSKSTGSNEKRGDEQEAGISGTPGIISPPPGSMRDVRLQAQIMSMNSFSFVSFFFLPSTCLKSSLHPKRELKVVHGR